MGKVTLILGRMVVPLCCMLMAAGLAYLANRCCTPPRYHDIVFTLMVLGGAGLGVLLEALCIASAGGGE